MVNFWLEDAVAHNASEHIVNVEIAADLDVGRAPEAHAALLAALEAIEETGASAAVELGEADGASGAAPLALQLLVSAQRSIPQERVRFGERAANALAAIGGKKES